MGCPAIQNTLVHHGLPPNNVLDGQWSQGGWKRTVKRLLLASQYADFMTECDHIPLSQCTEVKLGRTITHLSICHGFPRVTKRNITKIRLLVLPWSRVGYLQIPAQCLRTNLQALPFWTRRYRTLYLSLPHPLLSPYPSATDGRLGNCVVIGIRPDRFCRVHPRLSVDRRSTSTERDRRVYSQPAC